MIFEQSAMGAMLFYKNDYHDIYRHVFTTINILCKFGEDIFITEIDVKLDLKI